MGSETKPSSVEERYRILLEVSEAANAQLDFVAILEAVSHVLGSVVPVDVIGVATVNGDMVRAHGFHVVGHERKGGESFVDAAARGFNVAPDELPTYFPLAGSAVELVARTGRAYVADDLETTKRFPEDERLLAIGVRSYVRAPLFVHDRLIGVDHLLAPLGTPIHRRRGGDPRGGGAAHGDGRRRTRSPTRRSAD